MSAVELAPASPPPLPHSEPRPTRRGSARLEPAALAVVFAAAIALRLPYLWDIPRFSDELQEVLWSLSIARGEILPLTAVDSYYGPVWSYLLASAFALFGPSPALSRLIALVVSAAFVVLTYLVGRDVVGRWPAAISAGLMLTSGGTIVINSHTARSNNLTPLLTTIVLWLVWRALAERRWDCAGGSVLARRPDPRLLLPAGFVLGLALQTHLSVIALIPGILLYALGRARHLLRTPWPYLGAGAAVLGYANMLVYNLENSFWSFRHARSLQEGYTGGRSTDLDFYLTNLGSLIQSLSRLLSGTIDASDSPARYLYSLVALVGLGLLARRGGLVFALAALSIVGVLPYFNPRYGPILSGRYLIPLLPLCFIAIGCAVVVAAKQAAGRRPRLRWRPLASAAGLALILFPLAPLANYYRDAVADGRTNQPLYRLLDSIVAARQSDEPVLLDEGLAQEQLGAGGTDLKAFRMLLGTSSIPAEVAKVSDTDDGQLADGPSVLFLMEAKKRTSLPRSVRSIQLSPEVPSASGSGHRYAVYRLATR